MSVLGIDVGTSTCKGLVLNAEGKTLARRQTDYAKKPTVVRNLAEIPAEVFREGVFSIVKELAAIVKDTDPVQAIALSTHGETLIPVDKAGDALRPAMLSMDRRCVKQTERLAERVGKEVFYGICGTPIHSQYPVPKIMWLSENEKETAKKTARYCTAQDYLHGALGVGGYVDHSLASRFGGFDIRKRKWSDTVLNAAGIDEGLFSVPAVSGTPIGTIPKRIACELGLNENVLLVLGGHDQPCAALGMGAAGDTLTVSAGSYECVTVMSDEPLNPKDGYAYGLNSYCHVLKDKYVTLAFFASGLVVQWFVEKFCALESGDKAKAFERLQTLAPKTPTGICFTPHIYGSMNPCWDDKAKAKIIGLTAETGVAELYRALLEGAACELDLNVRILEKFTGEKRNAVFCGGGASSALWMQIRADILGKKIERLNGNVDASCMGAAILAGIGSGVFKDEKQAVEAIRYDKTEFSPLGVGAYETQKEQYRGLYKGLAI